MKKWLNQNLALGLLELSDIETQRDVWLARNPGGRISSWTEAVASTYDDSGYSMMREEGETCLGAELTAMLDGLGVRLEALGKNYWPSKLDIEGPLWEKTRQEAFHALALLKADPGYDWPAEVTWPFSSKQ